MNTAHQLFASCHVEVVKDVRQQHDIVPSPRSASNALPGRKATRSATPAATAFSLATARTGAQSAAVMCAFGFCLAMVMPNIPCPAAMSSTLHGFPSFAQATSAINPADTVVRGAMVLAKVTQSSSFGLVLSPCATDVPPVRTDSVSASKFLLCAALARKSAKVPIYAGECRLRKMADSCERV